MYRELYLQAQAVMKFAYAPFSKFRVGAAILNADGTMYTGVNIENSSYGATICAERVAACKAISEGAHDFEAIALCSDKGATWPCGICRQFLYEFSPELKVITGSDEWHLEVVELSDLLPKGFRL